MKTTIRKPSKLATHLICLPRWFALPLALLAVTLGYTLEGGPALYLIPALLAAACIMASLHALNTLVDFATGVDKPGGSVEKVYTAGSQVLVQGWASFKEVACNVVAWGVASIALTVVTAYLVHTWWPFYALGLALVFGGLYSPLWKYKGLPELCGLLGFGVGGVALGYSISGSMDLGHTFLAGIAISLPFAVSWAVDQVEDAPSDIKRGVHNIGGLLYTTGVPLWGYVALGVALTYVFLLLTVTVGVLSPWVMLALLCTPIWVLCICWLNKDLKKGEVYGLLGITAYSALVVLGQFISKL